MKFSIIVLLYNSELDKIIITLKSIIQQSLDDIEIVIADDGSKKNYCEEIVDFFNSVCFRKYKFTAQKENVGTVRNILDGLKISEGKYIRLIGAGDLLFNEKTLEVAYEYMENQQIKVCFGRMKQYKINEQRIIESEPFIAPKDFIIYQKNRTTKVRKIIKRNVLVFGDWISGASLFYDKRLLFDYLNQMKECVKYCEDLITALLVLNNIDVYFLDNFVTWYEVGEGISTSICNTNALNRVLNDQVNFYNYLINKYNDSELLKGRKILEYNNKGFLIKNRIKRLMLVPSRAVFSIIINLQKKNNIYDKVEKGFLDEKTWLN